MAFPDKLHPLFPDQLRDRHAGGLSDLIQVAKEGENGITKIVTGHTSGSTVSMITLSKWR